MKKIVAEDNQEYISFNTLKNAIERNIGSSHGIVKEYMQLLASQGVIIEDTHNPTLFKINRGKLQ